MNTTTNLLEMRELDARDSDGVEVRLLWHPTGNRILVHVIDSRTDDMFVVHVSSADALDAFRHPFAYIPSAYRRKLDPAGTPGEEVTT